MQIEYALNAVQAGATSLGISACDGVVIATEKKLPSSLVDESTVQKISTLTPNVAVVYSGMGPDYRVLVRKARKTAQAYHSLYKENIPVAQLVREVATVMQEFTREWGQGEEGKGHAGGRACGRAGGRAACMHACVRAARSAMRAAADQHAASVGAHAAHATRARTHARSRAESGGVRPFGVSLMLAGYDDNGPQLYQIDPSGSYFAWKASAIGKNMVNAKAFLEKRYSDEVRLRARHGAARAPPYAHCVACCWPFAVRSGYARALLCTARACTLRVLLLRLCGPRHHHFRRFAPRRWASRTPCTLRCSR